MRDAQVRPDCRAPRAARLRISSLNEMFCQGRSRRSRPGSGKPSRIAAASRRVGCLVAQSRAAGNARDVSSDSRAYHHAPQMHVGVQPGSFDRFVPVDHDPPATDSEILRLIEHHRPLCPATSGTLNPGRCQFIRGARFARRDGGKSTCVLCLPCKRSRLPWFLCRFKRDLNRWHLLSSPNSMRTRARTRPRRNRTQARRMRRSMRWSRRRSPVGTATTIQMPLPRPSRRGRPRLLRGLPMQSARCSTGRPHKTSCRWTFSRA